MKAAMPLLIFLTSVDGMMGNDSQILTRSIDERLPEKCHKTETIRFSRKQD